jgi:putative flippase GtrA
VNVVWRIARATVTGIKVKAEAGRYILVVVAGFVVDLTVTWLTHQLLGLDLLPASALGFVVAMVLSYFVHELWTFRRPDSRVSLQRFMKFVAACSATLITRLALVSATGLIDALADASLVRLAIAFAGSLVVGFVLNRETVFTSANDRSR